MIQQTVDRLRPLIAPERIWVLTNDHVRDEIVRQLPEVPARQIIAEPSQRNTAPAIGLMATILESTDPNSVFSVFPSDHVIGNSRRLSEVRACGIPGGARRPELLCWGFIRRHPETQASPDEYRIPGRDPAWIGHGSPSIEFQRKAEIARRRADGQGRQLLLERGDVLFTPRRDAECHPRAFAEDRHPARRTAEVWRPDRSAALAQAFPSVRQHFHRLRTWCRRPRAAVA